MERSSHVLSLISHGVGVTVSSEAGQRNALEHVYFQRLADKKVLAVVVTRNGLVRDRVLRLSEDLPHGRPGSRRRLHQPEFPRLGDGSAAQRDRPAHAAGAQRIRPPDGVGGAALRAGSAGHRSARRRSVYVEGASNLVLTEQDKERLRQLLATLEEKQRIVDLLSAYLDVRQEAVRVVVGLEDAMPHLNNFVLIGTPARVGDEVMGSLAVIGPTRMDYEHTITAVSYIARHVRSTVE